MNRSGLVASAMLALATALLLVSPAAAADDALTVVSADVATYPDVRLVVAAPAQLGDQALTETAFRVVEGGQAQPLRVEALPSDQLEVALAIDTSGSMAGAPLAAAKAAAQSFLAQLPATVPVSVVGFGASPRIVSARSSNRAAQVSAVNSLTASGQTALYDALGAALSQLPAGSGTRRVVVLLTDGGDTTSTTSLEGTVAALAASGVPLFAVELRTAESNPVALSRLTNASAGRVVAASDPTGLAGAFDAIARQLVRQYAVTYTSTAHGAVDIDVTVESQGVRATARRHLDLPGAPVAPPGTTAAAGTVDGQVDSPRIGGWALAVGGALCGAALLGLLIPVVLSRTPRALGLATRRRGISLSGAATRAEAFGDTVLRRGGGHGAVSGVIEQAGLDVRPGELFVGVVVGSLAALLLGWVVVAPFVGAVLAAGVALSARIVLDVMARRRRTRFNAQLGETLQMLAGSLRAGHGLAQGVDSVSRESESPTAEEFRRLTIETRLGRDLVEALRALAARVGSDDFEWVVQAIEIQRDVGGDLAEVLDTVAGTIRDRARIRQQVSALSAEGRMSAWVLMLLPFGLLGMMSVTNREYLSPLFDSGTGHVLLGMGAVLLVVGGLWLKRIVKPVF